MEKITQIELMMTVAFVLYAIAILLGRNQIKWSLPRWVHISVGCSGFFLDMWATWDMEQLRKSGWEGFEGSYLLLGHTIVSTLAVVLFITMVILGIRRKIKTHRRVVWFAFAPIWFISYTSGLILVTMNDDQMLALNASNSIKSSNISIQQPVLESIEVKRASEFLRLN